MPINNKKILKGQQGITPAYVQATKPKEYGLLNNFVINKPQSLIGESDWSWKKPEFTSSTTRKSFKEGFGDFNNSMNSIFGSSWGSIGGGLMAGIGNAFAKDSSKFNELQQNSQNTIRGALAAIPVYGQAIAAATGALDAIGSLTDTNLSNINKDAASRQGLGGAAFFNNAINHLPGVSMLTYGIGAMFGGGKSQNFKASNEALSMQDGFSASSTDVGDAEELAGKNYFGGSWRRKANSTIDTARTTDRILKDINITNTQRKQSDYYQDLQNQNINRYSARSYTSIGKNGLKLMTAEEARRIIALKKENPEKLQNGGNIPASVDQSIVPEGKLHKELHHLDKVNPELAEDLTRKGIPVITVDENGDPEQVAEVERSEWTISKSLTDKLEYLLKEWLKEENDQIALEAGYAVAEELQNNTVNFSETLNNEENGE